MAKERSLDAMLQSTADTLAGAKIDAVGDMGQTPLHVAVMREDEFSADLLLRAGADPEVRSEFGDTPRELARQKGGRMKELLE